MMQAGTRIINFQPMQCLFSETNIIFVASALILNILCQHRRDDMNITGQNTMFTMCASLTNLLSRKCFNIIITL